MITPSVSFIRSISFFGNFSAKGKSPREIALALRDSAKKIPGNDGNVIISLLDSW